MISGIPSSLYHSQIVNQYQQLRAAFQELGSDLKSGNVAAAQNDFDNLVHLAPSDATKTTSGSQTSVQQEMQQLEKDLQSGNVAAAQQDYASIQRSLQQHLVVPKPMNPSDPINFAMNLASTAAASYGAAALTGPVGVGSMLSQLV